MSVTETIETFKALEDSRMHDYINKHNVFLRRIEDLEGQFENGLLGTVELAKMEYLYAKARLYAYLIAGYYKEQFKYFESRAEQERANLYERVKLGDYHEKIKGSTDAANIAKRAKGEELEKAAKHHGNFDRWVGIALSYESAIYAVKDMIKRTDHETRGGV